MAFKFKCIDYNDKTIFADRIKFINQEIVNIKDIINWAKKTIFYIDNNGKPFWVVKGRKFEGIEPIIVKKISDPYFNEKIKVINNDNKEEITTIEKIIKKNILEIYCETLEFIPFCDKTPITPEFDIYNSFDGFKYKYNENFIIKKNKLNYILNHIKKVLAGNNNKNYEYLLNWMAWIIQKPNKKTGVCCVFISEQGTGKNIFFEWFGKNIIGKKYYLYINNINNLVNRFNSETMDKLFTILDEMQMYDRHQKYQDQLKSIITETQRRIENKGMEPFLTNDYNNYVMFTNNDNPVHLDNSDRRYAMFNVSSCYKGNKEYYDKLYSELQNEEIQETFYHFLVNRDITKFYPERDIPKNNLKISLKVDSANLTTKFMIDIVRTDIPNDPLKDIINEISEKEKQFEVNKLYESMKIWNQECCPKEKIPSLNMFSRQLSKLMSKAINLNGKKVYLLNKKIISNALCKYFNVDNVEDLYSDEFIYDSGYETDDIIQEEYPLPIPIFENNENNEKVENYETYENSENINIENNEINEILDNINSEVMEECVIVPINEKKDKYKCKINGKIEYGTKKHLEKRLKPIKYEFEMKVDVNKYCSCGNLCDKIGEFWFTICKECKNKK